MSVMDSEENARPAISARKQAEILRGILENELTACQRQVFMKYHFGKKTMTQIAKECGVHKSTICRTLKRAEQKVKRFTQYIQI